MRQANGQYITTSTWGLIISKYSEEKTLLVAWMDEITHPTILPRL